MNALAQHRNTESLPAIWSSHPRDTVAVAMHDLEENEEISVRGKSLRTLEPIPAGHKIALSDHPAGQAVLRYGERIGLAKQDILTGQHVHSHNLATALVGEVDYGNYEHSGTGSHVAPLDTWQGYARSDGRFATRNEIWLLPTVGCVAPLVEMVGREANALHAEEVDAVIGFGHPHGCSQLGDDLEGTRNILAALCDNPNAGGVVLVGLGCESNQLDALIDRVPQRSRAKLRTMLAQDPGDERERLLGIIRELAGELAKSRREEAPASALTVGLKCGGSDALSGLTANPLLGRFSDRLGASGGKLVLTEIPEIFGAENALFARAADAGVHSEASELLNRFKRYFIEQGQPVSENPSPGNIAGGITTLEEKSLGAVQKGGSVPLVDVIDYGGQASEPGLTLLEAPGNDAVSSTALAAAGATLILFTTGRGTPLGFPVPTVKVASNSRLAREKTSWIDFDASRVLNESDNSTVDDFSRYLLDVASGQQTTAERSGQRVISIWKRGVTL
ncbi:altronate dehydratase [Altererythrobacter aurantiacus]|uniref:Altronate dehydratase n=1 Tax=Parapontixanthobacter aurantiacus TaxID=1463599 RepID=A0A844ZAY6_9SPHN|nr:altronate dehydratase family protein [Parapontixanthobacter aurantiacus]MXO84462.1 altronate dehydratase [Parapontixanthobacter aurantiacus]